MTKNNGLQQAGNCYKIAVLISCFFYMSGCAVISFTPVNLKQDALPGFYHRVEKSQTLWKISRMYNINLDELMRINRLTDISIIEIGQMLFIPQCYKQNSHANTLASEDFIWPIKGKVVAAFGQITNNTVNRGINIQACGDSNVLAARSGKVIFCSEKFLTFGKSIIIDHGDGFSSVYTGNSKVLTKPGDMVVKGMVIAKISSIASNKNSCLHFEIRKGYFPQNPNFYLPLTTGKN